MRKLLLTAIIPITLIAGACRTGQVMWAACEPGDNPWGTDGTWVLVCRNGQWEPTMTAAEYAQLLQGKQVANFTPLPTKPTTTTTTTAAPTTTTATTTTVPVNAPDITSANRPAGSTAGGQEIILTGTGFTGVTSVTIGGTPVTSLTVDSDTQITATTGAHATEEVVSIVVTNPGGSDTLAGAFEYIDTPVITAITPGSGDAGDVVVITGTDFSGTTFGGLPEVNFEATPAALVVRDSATQLTVTLPAGFTAEDASVTVNTWGGTSNAFLFTFN